MPKWAKCVVPHCGHVHQKNPGCIYARFPKESARCKEWVRRVGVEDLIYLPIEKLNGIRNVCSCHFTVDQFTNSSKKRLKNTAVPSILDARVSPLTEELMANFLLSDVVKIPTQAKRVPISQKDLKAKPRARADNGEVVSHTPSNQPPPNCEMEHSCPSVMENVPLLGKPTNTVVCSVSVHAPMEFSGDVIEDKSPIVRIPQEGQPGCFNINVSSQVTPQRGVNQYRPWSKENADLLDNTRRITLLANPREHTPIQLPDEISELADQSASPVIARIPSGEQVSSLNGAILNQTTPKRGMKRRYRVSAVRNTESLMSNDSNHGIINITITLPGGITDAMTFKIKNLNSNEKKTIMKRIEEIINSLDATSQNLKILQ